VVLGCVSECWVVRVTLIPLFVRRYTTHSRVDRCWALRKRTQSYVQLWRPGSSILTPLTHTQSDASEVAVGRLLPKFLSRQEMVISTKVHAATGPGPNGRGLGRTHILNAIDGSSLSENKLRGCLRSSPFRPWRPA
jgi:hypothetical protein